MDIYLTEMEGEPLAPIGRQLRLPSLPEKFSYQSGNSFLTFNVIEQGPTILVSGLELVKISWSAVFYGEARRNNPNGLFREWQPPETMRELFRHWNVTRQPLRINITTTGLNYDVFLQTFKSEDSGAFGDIAYTVDFIHNIPPKIKSVRNNVANAQSQPQAAKESTQASVQKAYTVVSGDTLWGIAMKFYKDGSAWKRIYDANKDVIENAAKAHGMSNSSQGKWIWAGEKLVIP